MSGRLKDYLGKGPLVDRPATPDMPVGQSAYWLDTDTTTISHWNGSAWEDPDFTGPGSIPEAPIDGKLYGRKDAAWEEIVGGGGVPRPYVRDVIGSREVANGINIDNFATKGVIFSPNVDMTIHAMAVYLGLIVSESFQVKYRLVKIDNSGLILSVLGDTPTVTTPVMPASNACLNLTAFTSPIPVVKGDRLAFLAMRQDGTGTTPIRLYARTGSINISSYSSTFLGSASIANTNPIVGDTLTVGAFNYLGNILFEDTI